MQRFADRRDAVDVDYPFDRLTEIDDAEATAAPTLGGDGIAEPLSVREELNRTQSEMLGGRQRIERGLLRSGNWWGCPHYLEKRRSPSSLGRWHYAPGIWSYWVERDPSSAIVLTYYALLLERVQGVRPADFALVAASGRCIQRVPIAPYVENTLIAIERLEGILGFGRDPGPRLKKHCMQCGWRVACRRRAEEIGHLTLLPNMQADLLPRFGELGIRSLSDLAAASPTFLRSIPGFADEAKAKLIVERARAYCTGKPTVVGRPALPSHGHVEAFLDFETYESTVFLSGLLVRQGRRLRYHQYLASSDRRFRKANRDLVRHLERLPQNAAIFHYNWNERKNLVLLPGGARFAHRLVDVYPLVRKHAALPCKSLGVKEVASVLGLRAPNTGLDGRTVPMCWYEWCKTGHEAPRRRLLKYNRFDLYALAHVVDWLRVSDQDRQTES